MSGAAWVFLHDTLHTNPSSSYPYPYPYAQSDDVALFLD